MMINMEWMRNFREWLFGINIPMYERVHCPWFGGFRMAVLTTVVTFWLIYPMWTSNTYQKHYRLREIITSINLEGFVDNTDIKREDLPLSMQINSEAYIKMYNVEDCVIPYQGIGPTDGIFVITNFAVTNNKTNGTCPEDPVIGKCNEDNDCKNSPSFAYNGILTGRCIPSDVQHEVKACEIRGWCPTTRRTEPLRNGRAILEKVGNLRITVHSLAMFEGTNLYIHNIQQVKGVLNGSALAGCVYSANNNVMRYCPRFGIHDTVMQAEGTHPNETFSSIALKGAVVGIRVRYECNLDEIPLENCHPTYSLHRQDNILTNDGEGEMKGISQSLRAVNYHSATIKTVALYDGIRFMVDLEGRARRTELKSLWTSIGLLFSWLIVVLKVMPFVQQISLKGVRFLKTFWISVQKYFVEGSPQCVDDDDEDNLPP